MKRTFETLVIILLSIVVLHAAPRTTILVAGFQNIGDHADDNFNIILTKSLISYLSRLSDVNVVTYDTVERTVAANGFWRATVFDMDVIDSMGLSLNVQKVVFGNFQVDNATKIITVHYLIYNTADGQTVLARKLDGPAGIDVFDTIDAMAKKIAVAVVNRDVDFAALTAPTVVTNQSVITNQTVVTYVETRRVPAGPSRATMINTVVVPLGIAGLAVGGYLFNRPAQDLAVSYTEKYNLIISGVYSQESYDDAMSDYRTLQAYQVLQITSYSLAVALTGLEVYLWSRKPVIAENLQWIALPNYFGLTIRF